MSKFNKTLRISLLYALPLVWFMCILLVLNSTSPLKIGPVGILLVFVLFYAFGSSLLFAVAYAITKLLQLVLRRRLIAPKRLYYVSSIVALAPVFMVALNTLGQLRWIEVVLVLVLVSLGVFYSLRRTAPTS